MVNVVVINVTSLIEVDNSIYSVCHIGLSGMSFVVPDFDWLRNPFEIKTNQSKKVV